MLDMNLDGREAKRFVIASHNENRRWGYIQSSLTYFDEYNMRKYDEGYAVIHGFDAVSYTHLDVYKRQRLR